ncbi:MAG: hypothetical protein MZU79_02415 [Anaerotruncus sp.]|nr:hypothetical protein [Anaerotruncus sp.]
MSIPSELAWESGSQDQIRSQGATGEKVDIIKYEESVEKFAENALSPSKVQKVSILDKENRELEAIVNEDQYSLAIGTHGQNVRLASKLVGWTIDVKRVRQEGGDHEANGGYCRIGPSSGGGTNLK